MKKMEILKKTLGMGLKVKTPVSILISVLGIPAALLPLLLSKQLQRLTDLLFELTKGHQEVLGIVLGALAGLGGLFLLLQLFQFLADYYLVKDSYRTQLYMKEYLHRHICYVHYSYLENRDDFFKKIEFADGFTREFMCRSVQMVFQVLQKLVTFFSVAIALWAVHPVLVVIVVVTSVPAAILSYRQSDETFRGRSKWMEEGHMAILLYHMCASSDEGIQEVRHYELFDYLKARWRAVADSYIFKKNQLTRKHLKANLLADFLRSAVYLAILFVTAWKIYENPAMGLGVFTLVYTLSDRLQKSIAWILTEVMQFAGSFSYLEEFFGLEDLEREETHVQKDAGREEDGSISFRGVSFTYPGSEREVLHDLSLEIRDGEKIAIVGDNGSGKSTFISLLTGMFTPQKGSVCVGGKSMQEHKQELRQRISVIFQDFAHYEGTLRENITVSDAERNALDAEICKMARDIHVEDVIEEQAEGLDGLLGHLSAKGNNLSGGQWQKIALLRAVYRDKTNIMVLDEPTAALDPLAEAELYRNFSRITGEKTTLLISHRLGITKLVDRILVFKDGRIIEDGSHQELMEKRGHYFDMYEAQAAWYQTE